MKKQMPSPQPRADGFPRLLLAMVLALAACLAPARAESRLPATAEIHFSGSSTLHDFAGRVSAQPFFLTLSSNLWSAKGSVLSGEMTTANAARDRKMWEMLGAAVHLSLAGEVPPSPLPPAAGTNITLRLRIRDQEHSLPVRIRNWNETAERIEFDAAWEVSLKQYGLKPPSVIGVIRVGDTVRIDARIVARKTPAPVPATAAATKF